MAKMSRRLQQHRIKTRNSFIFWVGLWNLHWFIPLVYFDVSPGVCIVIFFVSFIYMGGPVSDVILNVKDVSDKRRRIDGDIDSIMIHKNVSYAQAKRIYYRRERESKPHKSKSWLNKHGPYEREGFEEYD